MKDAFGSFYYINLGMVFFVAFASVLAVALNYTKAFRVKNTIINYIEANNGLTPALQDDIIAYVDSVNYYVRDVDTYVHNENQGSSIYSYREFSFLDGCNKRGYCIDRVFEEKNNGAYYKVQTWMNIEFPIFGLTFRMPVTGETKLVSEQYIK